MSNSLNECDDTFWNGSILGYWLKYTHTRKRVTPYFAVWLVALHR